MAEVGEKITGYCMKCRTKVEIEVTDASKTKKNTTMNKGKCPDCGTTVCVLSK